MAHHLRGLFPSTKFDFWREGLIVIVGAVPKSYSFTSVEARVFCVSVRIHRGKHMQTYLISSFILILECKKWIEFQRG